MTYASNSVREETPKRYVHEADRICELFGQRSEIIEQRVRENNAHASYIEIRRQLFEATRFGYDGSN